MARGGSRIGSGRPPGAINARTRAILEQAASGGETPFAYVLRIMRDEEARDVRRDNMAKAAIAYLSKLSKRWDVAGDEEEPTPEAETPRSETEVAAPAALAERSE